MDMRVESIGVSPHFFTLDFTIGISFLCLFGFFSIQFFTSVFVMVLCRIFFMLSENDPWKA